MTTVGLSALAAQSGLFGLTSTLLAESPTADAKLRVRVVFLRPKTDRYWMGWPGACYDIKAREADYVKTMTDAAEKWGVKLEVDAEPIVDMPAVDKLLAECKQCPPDGIIVTVGALQPDYWPYANKFVAEKGDLPAIVFSPMCALLTGRPGFMQDPAPNTVNNTLMGAHCSTPTKLRGFDQPAEPLILRSHSESEMGVSPQVIWPQAEPVTLMKFDGPAKMILGTGQVVTNIDTPPCGGCRTSVELKIDNLSDSRDCKGFHQLFVLGKHDRLIQAYCQLAGIEVVPI